MAACTLHAHARVRPAAESATAVGRTRPDSCKQEFCRCSTPRSPVGVASLSSCSSSYALGKREHLGRSLHLHIAMPESYQLSRLRVEAAKRVQTGRSYALSSTLVVEEGKEAEVTSMCKEVIQWAEAKMKEKGSGLQVFECNVDPFEKNVYHFWEVYASFTIMNDLRSSPEHSTFMAKVRPLLVSPIGLAVYEYRDGQIGHMMNPIGPKGEGGLDDATGQAGTKQQSSSIGQGLGELEEDEGSKAWGLDKILAKVRGEDKDGGWSFKTLFGGIVKDKASK